MKPAHRHNGVRYVHSLWLLATCTFLAPSSTLRSQAADRPNVLLICVDDLRPELHCYGVDYIHSPNIDRLASQGVLFENHYVQAPTCGASRYTLLTGRYGGRSNEAIFQRADKIAAGEKIAPSMPEWFRQHGYRTVSVGKVSHHPGGRGGPDWNDDAIIEMPDAWDEHLCPSGAWLHPRGFMHGLANGEIRQDAQNMDLFQSTAGDDSIYPDGLTTAAALDQLQKLTQNSKQPFFLAVGILRPHLPFGAPAKYMEPYINAQLPATPHPEKPTGNTTWHNSGEFMKYHRWGRNPNQDAQFAIEVRKHYAACVTYADAQIGRLLDELESVGAKENTIVVLWGDHGWHLGEHAIWGKHALFEESLRSPLIISAPASKFASVHSNAIVETLDIFPTLCELANLPPPNFVHGQSLVGVLRGDATPKSIAVSYSPQARTLRTERYRFIHHRDGPVELYDHQSQPGETLNIAPQSAAICADLQKLLDERLPAVKN